MRNRPRRAAVGAATTAFVIALVLAPLAASAQTPYIPYFGKNRIHYDNFEWHIYTTDHFEIYYYPELEQHLARVAGYAESAYQQISADLKHDREIILGSRGDLRWANGDGSGALADWQAALPIAEHLVGLDAANQVWRDELATLRQKLRRSPRAAPRASRSPR